jgi:hypothetical protein
MQNNYEVKNPVKGPKDIFCNPKKPRNARNYESGKSSKQKKIPNEKKDQTRKIVKIQ